ncbi:MAG TPA: cytochrome C oxidase subunit IV family protein [bacterium]|nr:cytochrome C oxidase subunit IV family protein [bacterium]
MAQEVQASKEHIISAKTYLTVGAALFLLTGLTVAISFVHLGPFNLVVAIGIAALKASLVAFIFMHLYYDNKLYLTIFLMAILMLAFFIVLTLFDTLRRGDLYQEVAGPYSGQPQVVETAGADTSSAAMQTTESDTVSADSQQTAH